MPSDAQSALHELGDFLSLARRARGDTLEVCAQRCGVHVQTLSRIERGDPGVAIGTVFWVLSNYGMAQRLFDLSEMDETTSILLQKNAPQRPRS